MLARTVSGQAHSAGMVERMTEYDMDLVRVSIHHTETLMYPSMRAKFIRSQAKVENIKADAEKNSYLSPKLPPSFNPLL